LALVEKLFEEREPLSHSTIRSPRPAGNPRHPALSAAPDAQGGGRLIAMNRVGQRFVHGRKGFDPIQILANAADPPAPFGTKAFGRHHF